MGLKPGQTNNPAGRPKGSPNKITTRLKGKIEKFLSKNWQDIEGDFQKLEPKDRIALYERLLQYAIPRQTNINIASELEKMLQNLDENTLVSIAEEIIRIQNQK